MWLMVTSLRELVESLSGAFTLPSLVTTGQLLLGWVMCLGSHTLQRVAHSAQPQVVPDNSQRHGLDGYYNYFERSAWSVSDLAKHLAVLVVTRLNLLGPLTLIVDDTLNHKRGKSVWGLGWFRDAVASTHKRVATASGHNWVVLAVAVCLPFTCCPILALPVLARLHQPGQLSCADLARQLLTEFVAWFPARDLLLLG